MGMIEETQLKEIKENFEKFLSDKFPNAENPLVYYNFKGNVYAPTRQNLNINEFNNYNNIVLNIPSILISNSKHRTHLIEELWVLLIFDRDSSLSGIYCCRSKMSYREYRVSYVFSHAERKSDDNFGYWRHLCFGRGEIANYISKLHYANYDKLLYLVLPQILWDYFSWESIEGGPYVRISEIYEDAKINLEADLDKCGYFRRCEGCKLIFSIIKNDLKTVMHKVSLSYANGTLYFTEINLIRLNYNLYKLLSKENNFKAYKTSDPVIVYKGKKYNTKCYIHRFRDNGEELTNSSDVTINEADNDRVLFTISGKEIKSTLYKNNNDIDTIVLFLAPKFTVEVASCILRYLNPINLKIC